MKRKILSLPIAVALLTTHITGVSANAVTSSRLVDNDPIASGCSFNYGYMTYYSGISGSYNNDMRLSDLSIRNDANAEWCFPVIYTSVKSCNVTLRVYLNHANFTDPEAVYLVKTQPDSSTIIGTIDQKYAIGGWNELSKTISKSKYIEIYSVSVGSSYGTYKQLGADAINLEISY